MKTSQRTVTRSKHCFMDTVGGGLWIAVVALQPSIVPVRMSNAMRSDGWFYAHPQHISDVHHIRVFGGVLGARLPDQELIWVSQSENIAKIGEHSPKRIQKRSKNSNTAICQANRIRVHQTEIFDSIHVTLGLMLFRGTLGNFITSRG